MKEYMRRRGREIGREGTWRKEFSSLGDHREGIRSEWGLGFFPQVVYMKNSSWANSGAWDLSLAQSQAQLVLGLGVHNLCSIQILMILEKILQFYAGGMWAQAWPGSNCTPSWGQKTILAFQPTNPWESNLVFFGLIDPFKFQVGFMSTF